MLPILASATILLAAVAAIVSLADSAVVARAVIADLVRERALARQGCVPQVTPQDVRLRRMARHAAGPFTENPARMRGLPLRFAGLAAVAA